MRPLGESMWRGRGKALLTISVVTAILAFPPNADSRPRQSPSPQPSPLPLATPVDQLTTAFSAYELAVDAILQSESIYAALYCPGKRSPEQPLPYPGDFLDEQEEIRLASLPPHDLPVEDTEDAEDGFESEEDGRCPRVAGHDLETVTLATAIHSFIVLVTRKGMETETEQQPPETESKPQETAPPPQPTNKLRDLRPEKDPMGGNHAGVPRR